jgi:hypothetical protein
VALRFLVGVILCGLVAHVAAVGVCSQVVPTAKEPDPCADERAELGKYAMEAARTLSAIVIGAGSLRGP